MASALSPGRRAIWIQSLLGRLQTALHSSVVDCRNTWLSVVACRAKQKARRAFALRAPRLLAFLRRRWWRGRSFDRLHHMRSRFLLGYLDGRELPVSCVTTDFAHGRVPFCQRQKIPDYLLESRANHGKLNVLAVSSYDLSHPGPGTVRGKKPRLHPRLFAFWKKHYIWGHPLIRVSTDSVPAQVLFTSQGA